MAAHAWIVGVSAERSAQPEHHHARADRAAGDDEAFVPPCDERGDLGGQPLELRHVEGRRVRE